VRPPPSDLSPEGRQPAAIGPWRLALRRLRRNYVTLFFLALLVLLVLVCLLAPVYSAHIAGIGPNTNNITGTVSVNGTQQNIVSLSGVPIGPTWGAHYLLGADTNGRDLAVRLLYGGRTSLLIGAVAFIIGVVYVPYLGKPIRGEVLRLREQDFIDAARVQGMGPWRIMFSEILPNVSTTIIVFLPLILANSILLEAYLSFLGAGVQAPNASWGTLISDGLAYIQTTPTYSLIPGAMLVLTVLSVNVVGDGVRDALDPRAQIRVRN
jgi:ABC-type dipeptide/oligopeptide/nickel transport system permease subunit